MEGACNIKTGKVIDLSVIDIGLFKESFSLQSGHYCNLPVPNLQPTAN